MSSKRFLRGTFLLTFATMTSKFLGFIYVVPFTILVGTQGYILYEYAYKPYTIILSMATMGVPLAVSKFVSKYNAMGDYYTGRRLFRSGLLLMTFTGLITCLLLFFLAPFLATLLSDGADAGNTPEQITFVIRMVSFALLVVPIMSLIRGYFQGFQSMGPTASSQVVEQIVRLVFILAASLLVLQVFRGSISAAVGLATFGAFVGAVGGLVVLLRYWSKRRHDLNELLRQSTVRNEVTLPAMYKELITYAIPFVIVGLAIPLYQTADTYMVNSALRGIGYTLLEAESVNSAISLAQKLILIPVSLATAFSLSLIPAITQSYTARDLRTLHQQVTQTFQTLLWLTVPASIGLSLLAYPAYTTLFGLNNNPELGGYVLQWYAPTAIMLALFSVTAAMLQGINRQRAAVVGFIGGFLIKLATNYAFIQQFAEVGTVLTTNIGLFFSISFNMWVLHRFAYYRYRQLLKPLLQIALAVGCMAVIVWGVKYALTAVLPNIMAHQYVQAILVLLTGVVAGVVSYFMLSVRLGLFHRLLGRRRQALNKGHQT